MFDVRDICDVCDMFEVCDICDIFDVCDTMFDICVEFLSHNIIRLQLVKIGILLMLSFLDD